MTTLEAIASALASVSTVAYKLSTRTHPRTDDELVVLDSSGSDVAEDGSDDAAVRATMASLGFEFVDSGANGGPEGGYYSYWRAVSEYAGATICLAEDRVSVDPNGEMSDDEAESAFEFIRDAVREAFPGARVRTITGLHTSATMRDGTDFARDVNDIVQDAWNDWCGQGDEDSDGDEAPSYETTITRLDSADARGLRMEIRETITTAYIEEAPMRGETRPWSELDADDRAWWADWLQRLHAVKVACEELDEDDRDAVWSEYHDAGGDAEDALSRAERALADVTKETSDD